MSERSRVIFPPIYAEPPEVRFDWGKIAAGAAPSPYTVDFEARIVSPEAIEQMIERGKEFKRWADEQVAEAVEHGALRLPEDP